MRKWLLGLLALLLVGAAAGIYYVETKYLGIGLPWTDEIELAEMPDLPGPTAPIDADTQGKIYFGTKSPYDFSRLLTGYDALETHSGLGELYLPDIADADNPVPAIIILHGSGGIKPERETAYARMFNAMGIAAFVLDYYAPRGSADEPHYIRKVLSATEADIMVDALSAQKMLAGHPAINAEKIGVTGYSYGGMVTRYLMDPRIKNLVAPDVPPFALYMDLYGPCHQTLGTDKTTGGAYLAIFGDEDNSVDPEACARVQKVMRANGMSVESHILKGAAHAWEIDAKRERYDNPYVRGCEFSYDPETGHPLVDGKAVSHAADGATRGQRALVRTAIQIEAPDCVGEGYEMGSDPEADKKAKAIMARFLKAQGFTNKDSE